MLESACIFSIDGKNSPDYVAEKVLLAYIPNHIDNNNIELKFNVDWWAKNQQNTVLTRPPMQRDHVPGLARAGRAHF